MTLPKSRKDREYQKFTEDGSGNVAIRVVDVGNNGYATLTDGKLTQSENPQAEIEDIVYVAPSTTVFGTRNGTFDYPFASLQDAADYYGDPIDQADYEKFCAIKYLNTPITTENVDLSTRRYRIYTEGGTFTTNITVNVDNALRFGSSFSPSIDFYSATRPNGTQVIGNMLWQLSGTAVSNITIRFSGVNWTGNVTVADGVNGGASVTSGSASQLILANSQITGTFLGRNVGIAQINGAIGGNVEAQAPLSSDIAQYLGSTISWYGTSTTVRNIKNLTLSSAGGVIWSNIGVGLRVSADEYTWRQIALRTTGSFTNAFVPQNRLPALTAADTNTINTGDATTDAVLNNMRTRIDELEDRLQSTNTIS